MARRRTSRRTIRGKPNYLWIQTAGEFSLTEHMTSHDAILIPGDWSGTVTESQCTLLRMVFTVYTKTLSDTSLPHAQNAVLHMADASGLSAPDSVDVSNVNDWPDWFMTYDRILRIFRLEWDGAVNTGAPAMPVQFSQLPDPIINLKAPRLLRGDDSIRLSVGGALTIATTEAPTVVWFARSLVRTGLR